MRDEAGLGWFSRQSHATARAGEIAVLKRLGLQSECALNHGAGVLLDKSKDPLGKQAGVERVANCAGPTPVEVMKVT